MTMTILTKLDNLIDILMLEVEITTINTRMNEIDIISLQDRVAHENQMELPINKR
jgi:hypothetical protein